MKFAVYAAIAALGLVAAACATQPEPAPEPAPEPVTQPEPEPTEPAGPTPGSAEDFEATAGDRVFYGFDRYDLTPEARETLRRQAAWLASYPGVRILIAGNADERGTREYNLALGARRANAARDYLVSQGVDPSRISTVSYGKERPVCTESTERCWALNRNATTVITDGATS
ncbi:peptidoglycan-associated lipoprotein Pal [Marinicauda salina]|jgi:peptidoglycan-associated lipoprotein|uniref:Peptidoglycan-associated lipoprotein n=1 Tax=Marinicauda salina TaxID=2135793 RepID=A0A2U2BQX8_9PROT|nr:peptidoglycan-associated lipoprotein Pal [Marinicauda salina]PWE16420.1 peptidoglycan-associated lipoprotein Pal [Marinicauda salina]